MGNTISDSSSSSLAKSVSGGDDPKTPSDNSTKDESTVKGKRNNAASFFKKLNPFSKADANTKPKLVTAGDLINGGDSTEQPESTSKIGKAFGNLRKNAGAKLSKLGIIGTPKENATPEPQSFNLLDFDQRELDVIGPELADATYVAPNEEGKPQRNLDPHAIIVLHEDLQSYGEIMDKKVQDAKNILNTQDGSDIDPGQRDRFNVTLDTTKLSDLSKQTLQAFVFRKTMEDNGLI